MGEIEKLSTMAELLLNTGQLNKAMELYRQVCELDPDKAEAWLMQGAINAECGEVDKGINCVLRAIQIDSQYPEAHLTLANIYKSRNNFDGALQEANKAVAIDANHDEAWAFLSSVYLSQGQYLQTIKCAQRALELWPESKDAYNNLTIASVGYCKELFKLKHYEDAHSYCINALNIQPEVSDLHFLLGRIHETRDITSFKAAERSYREAINIQPDHVAATYQLARVLEKQSDDFSAELYFQRVIELNTIDRKPGELSTRAKFQIANIYLRNNKKNEAVEYLRDVMKLMPDHVGAKHILASLGVLSTPIRASRDYVVSLFDEMAGGFDQHLVGELDYHIPVMIRDIASDVLGVEYSDLRILDLGCGTGLIGYHLKDSVPQYLVGIDLSPNMINKAQEKNVYDLLLVGDIVEVMQDISETFDLIVSGDVFIYIGDLSKIFQSCAISIELGGLMIFSIELEESDSDYVLRDTGRYAHNAAYIYSLANTYMFEVVDSMNTDIRNDYGKPINGLLIVLRKS
jgi:predicted TPR repeat methyltransferase